MFTKKFKILYNLYHTMLFKLRQPVVQILIKQCMERCSPSKVSVSSGNIKYPIGKSIFTVNLPLPKSLHTLFGPHPGEIWTKSYGPKCKSFELLAKKNLFKTIFDKEFTPFCKTFLLLKILSKGKLLILRLLSFSILKIRIVQHV